MTAGTERNAGHISIIQIGGQATLSECGKIYDEFRETDFFKLYFASRQKPTDFYQDGFFTAPIREMNFDETFYGMHYDCHDSE